MDASDDTDMARDWTRNGVGLKLLVAVMTALLALGLVLLVVGLARTAGELGGAADGAAGFADLRLELPAGSQVEKMTAADGRLYLETVGADGRRQVLVVDAEAGRLLGRILLEPAP